MPFALLGLGANLGDRWQSLAQAVEFLRSTPGISAVRTSAWHSTAAIGGPAGQPEFLNGAAVVETSLPPESLLTRLLEIEHKLERVRAQPNGPRTIDLDLLLYDDIVQHTPTLQLPHPRMAFRRFVLQPAVEVAADMRHPLIGWTVAQLWQHLQTALPYVAISGALHAVTRPLAAAVAEKIGWKLLEFGQDDDEVEPASSPSLRVAHTIEFLREQADMLARNRTAAHGSGCISSFWIEDLLAIGDVLWPGALDETWQSLSPTVVPPKLLVVYEATSQQFQELEDVNQQPSSSAAVALWHRLNEARRQRAARAGVGSVLWLSAADRTTAETEIISAIQSMS